MELLKYKVAVRELADSKSTLIFGNLGEHHAATVVANIYRMAKDNVRIYAHNLNGDISDKDDYCKELEKFLHRGGALDVMLDHPEEAKGESAKAYRIIEQFKENNGSQVRIGAVKQGYKEIFDKVTKIFENNEIIFDNVHFALGDNSMFRLETNRENHEAIVCFNNTQISEQLISIFEDHFEVID